MPEIFFQFSGTILALFTQIKFITKLPAARIAQTIGVAANALIADSAGGVAQTVAVEVYPVVTHRTRGVAQIVSIKVHAVIANTAAGVSQ